MTRNTPPLRGRAHAAHLIPDRQPGRVSLGSVSASGRRQQLRLLLPRERERREEESNLRRWLARRRLLAHHGSCDASAAEHLEAAEHADGRVQAPDERRWAAGGRRTCGGRTEWGAALS